MKKAAATAAVATTGGAGRTPLTRAARLKSAAVSESHAELGAEGSGLITRTPAPLSSSTSTPASPSCPLHPQTAAAKPFHEIPGPKPLPIIGNVWRYTKLSGEYDITKMHENAHKMRAQFGPLVREKVIGNRVVVHAFNPHDMETVFRNEGRYPVRLSHRALLKYRLDREDRYRTGGLFPSNGEAWSELRAKFQAPMMRSSHLEVCRNQLYDIVDDLLDVAREQGSLSGEKDLTNLLYRWALESTGVVMFGKRLGCLGGTDAASERAQLLIDAISETHHITMLTENGLANLWNYFDTPTYKKLIAAQDLKSAILHQFLAENPTTAANTENATLLQRLLSLPGDARDVYTMIMDTFLAGIDTTTYAMTYLLYQLSTNPSSQARLSTEIRSLQARWGARPPMRVLEECAYLRACTRESHRLWPVAFGTGRILDQDVTLSGYNVPAGTIVLVHNQVACRDPEQFPYPDNYIPERWLRSQASSTTGGDEQLEKCPAVGTKRHHPFAFLPFGYGRRMCLGRRIADGIMNAFVSNVISKYSLEYKHNEPMGCYTKLINVPDQPLKVLFKKI